MIVKLSRFRKEWFREMLSGASDAEPPPDKVVSSGAERVILRLNQFRRELFRAVFSGASEAEQIPEKTVPGAVER